MPLNQLSLTIASGRPGRHFEANVVGLTTGRVEIGADGTPGFSYVNGRVIHPNLPGNLVVATVVLVEYDPGGTPARRESRIEITPTMVAELSRLRVDIPATISGAGSAPVTGSTGGAITVAVNPDSAWSVSGTTLSWSSAAIGKAGRPVLVESVSQSVPLVRQTSFGGAVIAASTPTPTPPPVAIIGMTASNTAKIRAALASTTRNAIAAAIGPSTTGGQSTGAGTAQAVSSWPMQMAAMLQAQGVNASAGNFFGDKAGWGSGSQTAAAFMAGDSRVVLTGSAAPTSFGTVGGNGIGMTAAGTIEFTPQIAVTKFDIYYRDAVGQDWSWSIDGGAATVVSGAANSGAPTKITIPAGSAGTHKLTITWVAGNARFVGVTGYNDASSRREMSVLNWGVSGARSAQFLEDVDTVASRSKVWTAIAPDLVILDDWAINDWRNSVSVADFRTNLAAGIAKGKVSGDVIVTTPLWDSSTAGLSSDQDSYAAATLDVAAAAGVIAVDIRAAWQSFAAANAKGWYSDTVHPTPLGYTNKATLMAYVLQQVRAVA